MARPLLSMWRRLAGLFQRHRNATPPEPTPFLVVDHDRMRRGPPGFGPEPSWISRPERDRLRRDLRTFGDDR